jgi:hypothetical protein
MGDNQMRWILAGLLFCTQPVYAEQFACTPVSLVNTNKSVIAADASDVLLLSSHIFSLPVLNWPLVMDESVDQIDLSSLWLDTRIAANRVKINLDCRPLTS